MQGQLEKEGGERICVFVHEYERRTRIRRLVYVFRRSFWGAELRGLLQSQALALKKSQQPNRENSLWWYELTVQCFLMRERHGTEQKNKPNGAGTPCQNCLSRAQKKKLREHLSPPTPVQWRICADVSDNFCNFTKLSIRYLHPLHAVIGQVRRNEKVNWVSTSKVVTIHPLGGRECVKPHFMEIYENDIFHLKPRMEEKSGSWKSFF